MAKDNEGFFEKQTSSSLIKANIVAKYFPSYCKIINRSPQKQIRYLDLFAGPGIYNDKSWSTPMLIAKSIASDEELRKKVYLLFNDNGYIDELKENFEKHFPPGTFSFDPRFGDKTVGSDQKITEYLTKERPHKNPFPTLLFFDPWGYKGINTKELAKFMEGWGNEIFLFVNIKRIHAAVENDKFDQLMQLLFPTTFEEIKKKRGYKASVHERLSLIMDNLANEFKIHIPKGLYHTSFKFQEEDSKATSHYIIHFTKHPRGYELVKQIYYDFDNIGADLEKEGTYTFDAKKMYQREDSLGFDFSEDNLRGLSEQLLESFKGQEISARDLFDQHHVNTKYCGSHYSQTLQKMANDGQILAKFVDNKKHRVSVTLSNTCILKFS